MWNIHQDTSKLMFAFEEPSHLPSLDGSTLEASWTGISGRYQCPNSVHQCEWKDVQRLLAYPCLCFCQVVATAGRCGNLCDSDFRQWFLSLRGTIFAGKLRISLWERRRREGASLSLSVFPCSPVAATSFWSLLVTSSQANLWYHLAGPPGAVPKKVLILGGKTSYSYTDIVQYLRMEKELLYCTLLVSQILILERWLGHRIFVQT